MSMKISNDTIVSRTLYLPACSAVAQPTAPPRNLVYYKISINRCMTNRPQWPRGLRRRSTAARLLRLWVRIPMGARMSVCCECCMLSGRGLCDELITRPEESYRLWFVVVCDLETSRMRKPWPALGRSATGGGGN